MSKEYELLMKNVNYIRSKVEFSPEIAIVLGSGLGDFYKNLDIKCEVSYSELDGFPVSTIQGHAGKFIFGYIDEIPLVVMAGRVHYYEGYDMNRVVMPIRLMGLLGAKKLILTNAAGGINFDFQPGDLMMITDHISAHVPSPLRGENIDELGPRFPDMSNVYNKELCSRIKGVAKQLNVPLKEGVYLQWQGPNFETPAEIKMFRLEGADAVGMSTACEAIAANHMKMKVCGISCITNLAAGMLDQPLSHEEVQETADRVKEKFKKLLLGIIRSI